MAATNPELDRPADALDDVEPLRPGLSRQQLVIHPSRIVGWGVGSPDGLAAS